MSRLLYFIIIILFFHLPDLLYGQSLSPVFPKDAQILSKSFSLKWNEHEDANEYRLKVYLNSTSGSLVHNSISPQNSKHVSLSEGLYYWQVEALINGMAIDSSDFYSFRVFEPNTIDSLNLWLAADSGVTLNGSQLSIWEDLSDSSLLVSQTNVSEQPTFIDSVLNNLPVVDFDAVNDVLFLDVALTKGNFSISAVYNTHEVSSRGIRLLDGTFNWLMGPHAGRHRGYNGGFLNGKDVILDQFVAHTITSFKDTTKNFVNNIFYGQNIAAYPPGNSLEIGANRLNGSLAELIIINGASHDSIRQIIDNYLMDKYAPPVNVGEDRIVCSFPDSVELDIDYALNYQWSNGDTTSKLVVDTPGKYYLTITDMFERPSVDSILIMADTLSYQVDLISDTTLCLGESLSLSAGSELYSYQWNTGATSNTIVVDSTATYRVDVLNCKGQMSSDSVTVNFNEPRFSLGQDTTICFHDSLVLEADSSFDVDYLWSNGLTDSSILAYQAGIYSLTVTDNYSCSYSDSIHVDVDSSLSNISLGADTSLCSGNSIGLIEPIVGIDSYLWNTNSTDSIIIVNNSQTYSLTVTDNGCQNVDSIEVTIKGQAPLTGFTAFDFCYQDSVRFMDTTRDPNNITLDRWLWDFGDGDTSTDQNPTHAFDSAGTYLVSLEVENDSTCIGVRQEAITIYPLPDLDFSVGLACEGDSTSFLNASQISSGIIDSYFWDFGIAIQIEDTSILTNPKYVFPTDSQYDVSLLGISDQGCLDSISKTINVNASPEVDFSFDGLFDDDSTYFTDQSSISNGSIETYQWDFGNNKSDSVADPTIFYGQTGTYYVTLNVISDSSCLGAKTDSVTITKRPPPRPEFNTVHPKNGQTVSDLTHFSWNEKDSATIYRIQVSSTVAFSSLVIDRQVSKEFLNIRLSLNLNDIWYWRVIARNETGNIDTTNTAKFRFFDPRKLDSLNLWIRADSGVIANNGLVSGWRDLSDSIVTVDQSIASRQPMFTDSVLNNLPTVDFDALDDEMNAAVALEGENFMISTVYNVKEESSRGIRLVDGTFNWLMGPHAGVHRGFNGAFLNGKAVVKDRFVAHSIISANDTNRNFVNDIFYDKSLAAYPPGSSLVLGKRLNGQLAEVIIVNGASSDQDRKNVDTYLMDKYAPPVNAGPDRRVCSFPDSIKLGIDYALDYEWSTGDSTDQVQIDSAGKYYVTITDVFERRSIDSVFFILDTSNYQVDLGFPDTTICEGKQIELNAGAERYSYSWNTLQNTASIIVDSSAIYKVSIVNCLGNSSVDSVRVTVNNPVFSLGSDTIVCFNQLISLQADSNFVNVNYTWSSGESTENIIADSSGSYALTVTDQSSCVFSDSIQISIDSSLYSITLGPDTVLCEGNLIGLQNPIVSIKDYLWDNGDTTATISLDTAGTYILSYSDDLCQNSDTIQITLKGRAPSADFISSEFCFLDTVEFTDISSPPLGDNLVEWEWLFGDGDSSQLTNPTHQFMQVGSFKTALSVTTDKGCIDTISKVIKIQPKPDADFSLTETCSKLPSTFSDNSSISQGSIVGYLWNFGDTSSSVNSSNLQNPVHQYDTLGHYPVSLIVESDQTCSDTIVKNKIVHPTPNVDFSFFGNCLSDSTKFQEQSVLASGSVAEYKWFFNGLQESTVRNPSIQYGSSGSKIITLRVTSDKGCQSIHRDTLIMRENPVASFQLNDYCEDELITVYDMSSSQDSIIEYQYILEPADTFNIKDPTFVRSDSGSYDLSLKIKTEYGCLDSTLSAIDVNPRPSADFSILNNGSGAPYQLKVNNNSSGANQYLWTFGTGDSSLLITPNYTYSDTGKYQLSLIAKSIIDCRDTMVKELRVLPYYLDALLEDLFLSETKDGRLNIQLRLANSGNNTIENLQFTADLNNEFQFTENLDTTIFKGKRASYQFKSSFIQDRGKKVNFVCVRIDKVNGVNDANLENNELCEKGFSDELSFNLFPNPATNKVNLEYTLPVEANIQFMIYDRLGREVMEEEIYNQKEGYYFAQIDVSGLNPGLYFYSFIYNGIKKEGALLIL